ncbi:unnamed protein product [Mesocestoides corti]|uniref:Cyclin N-terminal domain-containing protein n=1 Tax=Mesocestoides corti TaxID=53468 RepID=A0A0R3UAY3_MESCO|nr:unnamed protein product [Mesocestoides corti]
MLTRSRTGVSNSTHDENANVKVKNHGNTKSHHLGVHTRSRAVLVELKNINSSLVSQKAPKKPEIRGPTKASKDRRQPTKTLLCLNFPGLNPEEVSTFKSYCRHRKNLRTNFLSRKDSRRFFELDDDAGLDTASVSAFAETIFNYLQNRELSFQPVRPNFLDACVEITPRMRYILVNWLVQVHQSYKLLPETLYLCVAIMDRYIQKCGSEIRKGYFQLVGVTSLFIASKFEEMYPPDISDFSSITDNTYNKKDIRSCEQMILQTLDFYLSIPSPIVFLRRFSRALEADRLMHNLAKYFLELTIQEYDLACLPGNLRATIAICLALAICSHTSIIDDVWDEKIAYLSGYAIGDIRGPLQVLAKAVYRQNSPSKYRAIYDKYRTDDLYDKVAALPQLRSAVMEGLADLQFDEDGAEISAT